MKKLMLACVFMLISIFSSATDPGFLNFTATSCIGAGDGTLVAAGSFSFVATDQNDNVLPYKAGTGPYFQMTTTPVTWPIASGSVTGTREIANPASTDPANIRFRVIVKNTATNTITIYKQVTPTDDGAGNFNWCTYVISPTMLAAPITLTGATGPTGATGATGAAGPTGVVAATVPVTYNSGTQTVACPTCAIHATNEAFTSVATALITSTNDTLTLLTLGSCGFLACSGPPMTIATGSGSTGGGGGDISITGGNSSDIEANAGAIILTPGTGGAGGGSNLLLHGREIQNGTANNQTLLKMLRFTDTLPTGNFLDFENAAAASLWTVDITGSLAAGIVPGARVSGAVATATALAANGANCSAGNFPLGVDASGAVETCTPVAQTKAAVSGQPLLSYNAATGAFTQGTLASTDLSDSANIARLASANVFSVTQEVDKNAIASTDTDALKLMNTTASTSGAAVQQTPALHLGGRVWNTTATAADNWFDWIVEGTPTSGTTPTSKLIFKSSLSSTSTPSYTQRMSLSDIGDLTTAGQVIAGTNVQVSSGREILGSLSTGVRGVVTTSSSTAPVLTITRSDETTLGGWLALGCATTSCPALHPNGAQLDVKLGDNSANTQLNASVVNATTGFEISGAAATGNYIRGNGTNGVFSALLTSDLSGQVAVANGGTGAATSAAYSVFGNNTDSSAAPAFSSSSVSTKSADYTLVCATDYNKIIAATAATFLTLTMPSTACSTGWYTEIQNSGNAIIKLARNTHNIDGVATDLFLAPQQGLVIFSDGSNYFTERGKGDTVNDTSVVAISDDFIGGGSTTTTIGQQQWTMLSSGSCGTFSFPSTASSGHPGVIRLATGSVSGNDCDILQQNAASFGDLFAHSQSAAWEMNWIFAIPTTTTIGAYLGVNDNAIATPNANFAGVRYDTNSSDTVFKLCVISVGVQVCDTTTYTLDTAFHRLKIWSTTAQTIVMQFDSNAPRSFCSASCDVTVTIASGHLVTPYAFVKTFTGTARNLDIDYWSYRAVGLTR